MVTAKSVLNAFEVWRERLLEDGFYYSCDIYYRSGEYDVGPPVVFTADDIQLVRKGAGWGHVYSMQDVYSIPGSGSGWRLYFFGMEGIPSYFESNKDAWEYFRSAVSPSAGIFGA